MTKPGLTMHKNERSAVWAAVKHRLYVQLSHFKNWFLLNPYSRKLNISEAPQLLSPHQEYSLKSSPASKGHPKFDRSQHQLGGLITGCIWPMGYTGHAHRALFHLIWQGYGCCWALYSFLSFFLFFFPPRKQRCKISHSTIWQLHGGFPFAFKWDYTCYTMELSQNLTQQLDSAFSLGSAPVSNVIGSDLQFLGDLQLSFTKIISSV